MSWTGLNHQESLSHANVGDSHPHFDLFINNQKEARFTFGNTTHGDEFCMENGHIDLIHEEIKIIPHNESQEISEKLSLLKLLTE